MKAFLTHMRGTPIMAMVIICALAGTISYGRVFLRVQGTGSDIVERTPGSESLYRSKLIVNGNEADLNVSGWTHDMEYAMATLSRAAPSSAEVTSEAGESFGLVTTDDGTRMRHDLAIRLPAKSLVFSLDRRKQKTAAPRSSMDKHRLTAIPFYPGSIPELSVKNTDTGTDLEVSIAATDSDTVISFYEQQLAADGWVSPFTPAGNSTGQSGFRAYSRGRAVCLVLAKPLPESEETMITLLYKQVNTR